MWSIRKILLAVLMVCVPGTMYGQSAIWPDRPHNPAGYITIEAGGGYQHYIPGGYTGLRNIKQNISVLHFELAASKNLPVFSKLSWTGSPNTSFNDRRFARGDSDLMLYSMLGELKTPFDINFLSHSTPIYLQYSRSQYHTSAKASGDINYKGSYIVSKDDYLNIGEINNYYAVAVNTPVTNEDALYSYSRFGVYYSNILRPRSAYIPGNSDRWIFDVAEWSSGIFYDIYKPAFTKGLVLGMYMGVGIGMRELKANNAGYTSSDFNAARVMMFFKASPRIAYIVDITKHINLRFNADYIYRSLTSLQRSNPSSGVFNNNGSSQFTLGASLAVSF